MVTAPARAPVAFGVKKMLSVHFCPDLMVEVQLLVCEKSPLATILFTVRVLLVLLVKYSTDAPDFLPTAWPPTKSEGSTSGQLRWFRMSGGNGVWLKSKLSVMSLAFASRVVSGGTLKRSSMNLSTDSN